MKVTLKNILIVIGRCAKASFMEMFRLNPKKYNVKLIKICDQYFVTINGSRVDSSKTDDITKAEYNFNYTVAYYNPEIIKEVNVTANNSPS